MPTQALENGILHDHDVFSEEVSSAQFNEGGQPQLAGLVEFDGQVKGSHCRKLKDTPVDGAGGKVPIEVAEGYGNYLAVEVCRYA